MATPGPISQELEAKRYEAKQLIAAGGCHAISWWSWTDAERLCPEEHNKTLEPPEMQFDNEWIEMGKKAIDLIQRGVNLLAKIEQRGVSDDWKK